MLRRFILTVAAVAAAAGIAFAESLSGTYVMVAPDSTLTLVLQQDAQGALRGTLTSSTGASFRVDGEVSDGEGFGTCVGSRGGSYFEAQPEGERLLFLLIEPGPDRAPDYSRVRQLTFVRRAGSPGETAAAPLPERSEALPAPAQTPAATPPAYVTPSPDRAVEGGGIASSGEAVSDPAWSFTFKVPPGWKYRKADEGAVLGHDTIPGLLMILPHQETSLEGLQQLLQQGLQEDDVQLRLTGRLSQVQTNTLVGDYVGLAQGGEVKARGFGVLIPQGGGACIVALATPQVFGIELKAAAESVARSLRASVSAASSGPDLARHFVGTWVTMTRSTQTMVALFADGTFSRQYEASYSGGETGSWGHARNDRTRGRWTVRGTPQQGVMVLVDPDGSQTTVRYQVHVEKGQTYWREYFFNGTLYARK